MASVSNVDNMEKQMFELLTHAHGVVTLLQKEAEKPEPKPKPKPSSTAESVKDPVSAVPELQVVNTRREDKSTSLGRNMDPNFNGAITTIESKNPSNPIKTNKYDFSIKEP